MSAMTFRAKKGRKEVHLNVTSLIDVLFLLLIFFMLTGTFKRAGELELKLPDSRTAVTGDSDPLAPVELVATEDGRVLLNGDTIPEADLVRALEGLLGVSPDGKVLLKAEEGVPHGRVVGLLDAVREAGFLGVSIATETDRVPVENKP
ncbi:MAG: biopolymer transporter ExbD [Candidatus Eisenbacteria bacterium]|uniref:Biopolymer transporter ExbD n=1 Tax=Eiseniibacteriota bacterium TaxID=2212470 RepID=A0A7Y2EF43_UNCEI|nr:biopolymer transporter ExbD [Candidatus Eisenbacteria bacterium]